MASNACSLEKDFSSATSDWYHWLKLQDYRRASAGVLPDAGRQAGVRGVAFLLLGLAEVREAAADHRLALVEHQVQPVVGQLDEDEEDGDGGAVDAQSHGGGGQSLGRGEERSFIIFKPTSLNKSPDSTRTVFDLILQAVAVCSWWKSTNCLFPS